MYFLRTQVLTGDIPLPDVQDTAIGHRVLDGMRPKKPSNASSIGFVDPLWRFTQHCWDGRVELRPKVGEVVAQLQEVAANWDGVPPHLGPAAKSMFVGDASLTQAEFLGNHSP